MWANYFKRSTTKNKNKKRLKKKAKALAEATQPSPAQDDSVGVPCGVKEIEKFACEETGREEKEGTCDDDEKEGTCEDDTKGSPGEYMSRGF